MTQGAHYHISREFDIPPEDILAGIEISKLGEGDTLPADSGFYSFTFSAAPSGKEKGESRINPLPGSPGRQSAGTADAKWKAPSDAQRHFSMLPARFSPYPRPSLP